MCKCLSVVLAAALAMLVVSTNGLAYASSPVLKARYQAYLLPFDKQKSRQLKPEQAVDIVIDYIGLEWLLTPEASCGPEQVVALQPLSAGADNSVQLSAFAAMIEPRKGIYVALFDKLNGMCSMPTGSYDKDQAKELAEALNRLKSLPWPQLNKVLDTREQAARSAPLRDQLLDRVLDFYQARDISHRIISERAAKVREAAYIEKPPVYLGRYRVEIDAISTTGVINTRQQRHSKTKSNGKIKTSLELESSFHSNAGKRVNTTTASGYFESAFNEIVPAGFMLSNDEEVLDFQINGRNRKRERLRQNIQRQGSINLLPAELGKVYHFEQSYTYQGYAVEQQINAKELRDCVAVALTADHVSFECAGFVRHFANAVPHKKISHLLDERKYLSRFDLSLKNSMPSNIEINLSIRTGYQTDRQTMQQRFIPVQ